MAQNGTLFFNNSFPKFDDEYVGQILSDLAKDGIIHHNISRGLYLKTEETRFSLVLTVTARAVFSTSRCAAFDYITLNVHSAAFSNVLIRRWSLSVRQCYFKFVLFIESPLLLWEVFQINRQRQILAFKNTPEINHRMNGSLRNH